MGAYYRYYRNRACGCARCRISTGIGPAVLITLGVLFLFETLGVAHFHSTWPVLLIVIGGVKVLAYSASMEGHVPPFWQAPPAGPTVMPPVAPPPVAPPPSSSSSGGGSSNG
jgi:Domain of unknown function (DUF5668)